ncbi:chemotaxis protein MotA [Lacrimispora sphenoides]|jgi:chemotaxis protein MotA|uniref:motility protein A n=1 Tax=Lacrimispora sphenoides TaxID=29370 RepID=UPI0008C3A0DD|nr:MotA/TolQ/ExbB proton channel family protein [Lacrimispora sphenoides]SET95300.1 chemotaxis protein MotA [Lacrimispora sphenoides]
MDVSLIVGWVLGIVLIIYGIGADKLVNFLDMPSVIIVVGGTVAALIASFPFKTLAQIPKHIGIMISSNRYNSEAVIHTLVDMAKTARKKGLLVLEEQAATIKDPFLKQSVMLIVDAMDAEKIREMLESEVAAMIDRHEQDVSIYDRGSGVAPAFGMIGTLVGLVNMLKSMDMSGNGSNSLGADMSVALITTFYGCILAHLLFNPMGKKLRIRNEEEVLYKQIIIEGVLSIQAGDNPKYLEEKLLSYLSQKQQGKITMKKPVNEGSVNTD